MKRVATRSATGSSRFLGGTSPIRGSEQQRKLEEEREKQRQLELERQRGRDRDLGWEL